MPTRGKVFCGPLLAWSLLVFPAFAQTTARPSLKDRSWELLRAGLQSQNPEKRTLAVRVLSLLKDQPEAIKPAEDALRDQKPEVRAAAATALGAMNAATSVPQLKDALSDPDPSVVLAAAHSLLILKDKQAYDIYFAVLTGERKSGQGLIAEQTAIFKDPRKMAEFGFEEGIGFIPFASIGYNAIKTLMKDDSSPVRAAAAKVLAEDPDSRSGQALLEAAMGDKSALVRAAALDAIATRGDPSFIDRLEPALSDDKDSVQYTAAAAIVHLSAIAEDKKQVQPGKPKVHRGAHAHS